MPRHARCSMLGIAMLAATLLGPFFVIMQAGSARADTVLHLANGWDEHRPGGATICARGEPYAFFVRPGRSDKVVFDFVGGGACWSAATCTAEAGTFVDTVDDARRLTQSPLPEGIYDHERADNPVSDWTHVIVPYCTGDVHWGDADVQYTRANGSFFTIHHRGAVNARAVIDWAENALRAPASVFVTGCSAGAYGSAYWTPRLRQLYPAAQMTQLGDAGAGIQTAEFMQESFPLWNVTANAPRWIPSLDPDHIDWTRLNMFDFYIRAAAFDPTVQWAQYNAAQDFIQRLYYLRMGGQPEAWAEQMLASMANIRSVSPNFHNYLAGGDGHCATVIDDLYTINTSGVRLSEWLSSYVAGMVPDNVQCEGECVQDR